MFIRRVASAVSLVLVVTTLAACGSGSEGGSGGSGGSASDQAYLDGVQTDLDKYLSKTGTFHEPPKTSPKPAANKRIALISCGQAYPTCAAEIGAAKEAADVIGWDATIFDSKGDPSVAGSAIRSAVAQKYDGVFVYYLDCSYIKAPLQEAKAAGVPALGSELSDCGKGDQSLFINGGSVVYAGGDDFFEWLDDWARAQVLYPIAKLDGKAKFLQFQDTTSNGKAEAEILKNEVAKCGGCSASVFTFPVSDIGTKLQAEAQQQLLQHPEVNAVFPNYEGILVGGVAAAVKATGRDLLVSAGEGTADSAQYRESGLAKYGAGFAYEWEGYAIIDGFNRHFAGEPQADSGIGVQLYDKEHNWPAASGYTPPFDFASAYKKAWGVE